MELKSSEELIRFEDRIANLFDHGKIRYPVHLTSGNELQLMEVFKKIGENDWVFCSWRSHYHALLKGVPELEVEESILKGHSIALNFPEYNFYSSAIVAGQISIALGVALSQKLNGGESKVWCFMGDMTSQTGIARVSIEYAQNFDLPICFVIEDNNKSVCSNTREVWNTEELNYMKYENKVLSYKYQSRFPHAGAGKRVQF